MSTPFVEREAVVAADTVKTDIVATFAQYEAEAQRILTICNSCRYCEGFCAVFPAMTRRLEFLKNDIHYLANLCHNCGACLHACQYAAPHEFDVNVPRTMAQVRSQTYADYAWPPAFGALYARNGVVVALAIAISLALFLMLALFLNGTLWHQPLAGDFYAIFPHNTMVAMFGAVFLFAIVALGIGVARFWKVTASVEESGAVPAGAVGEATADVLTLKYLDGGHGEGCNESDSRFTLWRRRFHHLTFYGFMLCFAATVVGTFYHYLLSWPAPYPFFSLPVILGTLGGIGLLIGPAGLWVLNVRRHPDHGDTRQRPMDRAFLAQLFLVSLTGLALLAFRDTSAMAVLLAVHLGFVMAFFATMPYGKFAHGIYRPAALLKYALEKRTPNNLNLGAD